MKTISHPLLFSFLLSLLSLLSTSLFSQSPQSIPYQAVVRNADGTAMSNAVLTMIFKIHDVTATGTVVYQESQALTSNAQGLVSCFVGNGTAAQGTFANINWGSGAKFLHVLMNSGNGEIDLGTQQMMSVPYALYAEKSGGSVPTGSAPGELMYWNGQGWTSIPPGGYGQALVMCDGVPTWGGCVPKLGEVFVPFTRPTYTWFNCDIISTGDLVNPGNSAVCGFHVATDSLFSINFQNIVGSIQFNYQTSFYTINFYSIDLQPETTYYLRAYCENSVGIGYSPVKKLITDADIIGCIYPEACNYNPSANNFLDGNNYTSCLFVGSGCDDNNSNTMNDVITSNCVCEGIQIINGCTNSQACNYSASANADDGSCLFQGGTCDDGDVNTVNDVLDANCVCAGTLGGIGGLGSQLLPGNTTCTNEFISVTGCGGQSSQTYDGRTYDLVEIGGQCWFADNLATDQYRNGDLIPTGLDDASWGATTSGAYAIYNDDPANDAIYGKLYNWYTTVDARGVCPTGWHVPTDCEWMFMEGSLGMEIDQQQISGFRGTAEGGALKNVSGWSEPNVGATNSAGYSGIPGGGRNDLSAYYLQGIYGLWWTSGIVDLNYGWSRRLDFSYPFVDRYAYKKQFGFSIRCIKD